MFQPFDKIAISLSGGGYRASTFHLGALSYLEHVQYEGRPLLHNVKIISTISGGTFTGVGYVLALALAEEGKKDEAFKSCFEKLYGLFKDDQLVVEAMAMINNTKTWEAQEKNKNVINAFSEIYQAKFCDNHHLSDLLRKSEGHLGHLEEFCFNATDLYDSIPFRFQKTGMFGNGKRSMSLDDAYEIRLGDIMAASSCFPGGFEPMAFPKDFIKEKDSELDLAWKKKVADNNYPENIALMDGGILDNQGIESIELANNRRIKEGKELDTYIISDVSLRNPAPFTFPAAKKAGLLGNLTYRSMVALLLTSTALAILGTWYWWDASRLLLILSALLGTFSALSLFAIYKIQKALDNVVTKTVDEPSETPAILQNLDIVKKTPIYLLKYLVLTRFVSLSDIIENTFMARIRSLQLKYIYDSPSWEHKLISNNIYSLFTDYTEVEKFGIPAPSEQVLAMVELTATMPTSLWFTQKETEEAMLDKLIVSGQINLCFQLLRYLYEEADAFPDDQKKPLEALRKSIMEDYKKFNAKDNEYWLLKEYRPGV